MMFATPLTRTQEGDESAEITPSTAQDAESRAKIVKSCKTKIQARVEKKEVLLPTELAYLVEVIKEELATVSTTQPLQALLIAQDLFQELLPGPDYRIFAIRLKGSVLTTLEDFFNLAGKFLYNAKNLKQEAQRQLMNLKWVRGQRLQVLIDKVYHQAVLAEASPSDTIHHFLRSLGSVLNTSTQGLCHPQKKEARDFLLIDAGKVSMEGIPDNFSFTVESRRIEHPLSDLPRKSLERT